MSNEIKISNPMNTKGTREIQENQRYNVKWRSPFMGQIKGNFDGSNKENPRKAGCGDILRDHYVGTFKIFLENLFCLTKFYGNSMYICFGWS